MQQENDWFNRLFDEILPIIPLYGTAALNFH